MVPNICLVLVGIDLGVSPRFWNAAIMAVMFIFSTFVLLAFANFKLIKTTIGVSNIHNITNITKLHQNINFQSSFFHNSHTFLSFFPVFALRTCLSALIPYYRPAIRLISIIHLLPYFIIFATFWSLSLGQMHSFNLSTHSSGRHRYLIFRRIFRRFFAYLTRPRILVVSKPYPKIVISLTNFTFSTKFQPVSSQLTHACPFHLAFFPWTIGPCSLSLDRRFTVVAELGWISACFYSWLLEESRSIPVRHRHLTSLSVCWIQDQWSARHHYYRA